MARCEDYPCCGHVGSDGPCPDFDPETGKQLNMRCTCGAEVPLSSRSSLCSTCLRGGSRRDMDSDELDDGDDEDDDEDDEDYDGDPYDGDREFADYGYDYPSDY